MGVSFDLVFEDRWESLFDDLLSDEVSDNESFESDLVASKLELSFFFLGGDLPFLLEADSSFLLEEVLSFLPKAVVFFLLEEVVPFLLDVALSFGVGIGTSDSTFFPFFSPDEGMGTSAIALASQILLAII